jgi:hypothetical protein
MYFSFSAGAAINFTLEVGMPQMEKLAFPTSVIPTSGSVVTRQADVFTVPTTAAGANGAWYTQGVGTLLANGMVPYVDSSNSHRFATMDDGTINNYVLLTESATLDRAVTADAGSQTCLQSNLSTVANSLIKGAVSYGSSNIFAAYSGTSYSACGSTTIPTMTTLGVGSGNGGSAYYLDGWVDRVTYFPTQQLNASLPGYTQ